MWGVGKGKRRYLRIEVDTAVRELAESSLLLQLGGLLGILCVQGK